jgi:hypothetical protein
MVTPKVINCCSVSNLEKSINSELFLKNKTPSESIPTKIAVLKKIPENPFL